MTADIIGHHVKWLLDGTGNRVWGIVRAVNVPYLTVELESQPVIPSGDFDSYGRDARHKSGDMHFVHVRDVLDHMAARGPGVRML